jgi:hypothetical protein
MLQASSVITLFSPLKSKPYFLSLECHKRLEKECRRRQSKKTAKGKEKTQET